MTKEQAKKLVDRELILSTPNEDGTYTVVEGNVCDCGRLAYCSSMNIGFRSQAGFDQWARQYRPVVIKTLPPMMYATEDGAAECDACAKPEPVAQ